MNRIIKTLFLTAVLLAVASCAKDGMEGGGTPLPPVPEGYVRASISTNVSQNEQVKTRATDTEEKAYDDANVWVLMFNATSASDATPTTIMQAPVKATKTGTQLFALLRATAQPVTIYVVTGLTASMNTYLGTASNFTEGTTTYAAISALAQLQTVAVTAAGVPVGGTNYFPMCTDAISYTSGTTTLTEITANFKRIVAKIDVDASTLATADFALEGITLANGAQKGFVFPQTTLATNNGGVMQYTEVTGVSTTTPLNSILSQVYLYENNGTSNPTKVIVKGKYKGGASTYYRMDLHVESPAGSGVYTPYSMERNKHYTITITEIQNGGYATFNEALANKPSNAKYTITVTDPDSHDVVSNGEYYIGVSNSEFVAYGDGALPEFLCVTLNHNAPSSVATATIAISGTGLSFGTVNGTTGTTTLRTMTVRNATPQTIPVNIVMAASFTTAMTGTITIRLGDLTKTIKVTRKAQLSAWGGVISDFSGAEYVMGTVESSGTGDWLKLSANEDGSNPTSISSNTVVAPQGRIYLIVPENLPTSGGVLRTGGSFFASRRTDQGRVRVVAQQGFINMGIAPANPLPYPYVGAFWRANQRGERLIRMQVNANNLGAWSAKVLDGADWIVLDTQQSTDPNIGWKAGANESLVADMNTQDASYQVSGSATSVSGTAAVATDYIYFRIGLKSTYAATLAAPARYARVLVTYNNNTKAQVLYLRQGEADDYLFRPTDAYGNSPAGVSAPTWRPDAVKFSPYNLTDPNMGAGGSNVTDHNQLSLQTLSAGQNRFTDYPSQAGAFFQWASTPYTRFAYHPTNPSTGIITGWSSSSPTTYWNTLSANNETCPAGYRRPNDGITNAENTTNTVAGSEMRQSLYLAPQTGTDSDISNMLQGYYADGFFDRRQIQNSLGASPCLNSAVSNNDKNAAYFGHLFFNSNNNASLFFSAAGYRNRSDGTLNNAGFYSHYWSSSAYNTGYGWSLYFSNGNVRQYNSYRGTGFSVRCVLQ